ncbi:hypothetical protein KI387_025244, partial [Taxus chinensis]
VTNSITAEQHLKKNRSSSENDIQEMSSFPRICVTSVGPNLHIQIITWTDWCLLSSILLVLEQENLDVCSTHTISLQSKVFYTILVK